MKVDQYDSLDHSFKVNRPTTVEEFDKLADKAGACVEAAVTQEIMHGTLGDFREAFVDLLIEEHKFPRRDVGTGNFVEEDGKKVEVTKTETAATYVKRLAAHLNVDLATKPFQKTADRLSVGGDKEIKFDPKASVRQPGAGPVLAKTYKENAAKFIADPKTLPKVLANLGKVLNKKVEIVGDTDEAKVLSLGWTLKAYQDEMMKRNAATLTA